jgi:hypothetical protein
VCRLVLVLHGVVLVCDARRGLRPWRLLWTGGHLPRFCQSSMECSCSLDVHGTMKPRTGYVILRSACWDCCWHNMSRCDVCVVELSTRSIDILVESILPFFVELRGGRVSPGTVVCGLWNVSFAWRRSLYHSLHRRVLGCIRT